MARRNEEAEENAINVQVARLGEEVRTFHVKGETTVEDLLELAGEEVDEAEKVRVNGDEVELDDILDDGDILTISGKIKGGC